jgi:hypothetical protein
MTTRPKPKRRKRPVIRPFYTEADICAARARGYLIGLAHGKRLAKVGL